MLVCSRPARSPPAARKARCACRGPAPSKAARSSNPKLHPNPNPRPNPNPHPNPGLDPNRRPSPNPHPRSAMSEFGYRGQPAVRRGGAARRDRRPPSGRRPTSIRALRPACGHVAAALLRGLRRAAGAALLCAEGERQSRGDPHPGRPGRRRRHGFGGRAPRALAAGVPAERIVFSGVGKTATRWPCARRAASPQFNVESEPELVVLGARRRGAPAARAMAHPGQSRRRRQRPRQDQHRPPPGQVRHRLRPGARGL